MAEESGHASLAAGVSALDDSKPGNPELRALRAQGPAVATAVFALVAPVSLYKRIMDGRSASQVGAYDGVQRSRRILNLAVNLGEKPDPERHGAIVDRHLEIETLAAMRLGHGLFTRRRLGPTTVKGADHVLDALAKGKGVVVWRMNFSNPGPLNRALAELGHPAVHLSEDIHMVMPGSRLSARVLAPLLIRDEGRSLRERVVFSRNSGGLGYLKHLKRCLDENHVVTIVGDSRRGRKMLPARVLDRPWGVPSGAASLAHSTGAALLTALVLDEPGGGSRVIIGPPIEADRSSRRAFRSEAVMQFGQRLDYRIRAHPENRPSISLKLG